MSCMTTRITPIGENQRQRQASPLFSKTPVERGHGDKNITN